VAWLLVFALLISNVTSAQERFGELQGTATDPTGAVVPNAKISIRNKETNRIYDTQTASDGAWIIRDIDPGRYALTAESPGFSRYEVPDFSSLSGVRFGSIPSFRSAPLARLCR